MGRFAQRLQPQLTLDFDSTWCYTEARARLKVSTIQTIIGLTQLVYKSS